MNAKLAALYAKVQPLMAKAYASSPFLCGVAAGYLGKPIIKFAIDASPKILKFIFG